MNKYLLFLLLSLNFGFFSYSQQLYCNYEGICDIDYYSHTGVLDTNSLNPLSDDINSSSYCAKYIRDTSTYDFIKFYPYRRLVDVTPFVNNNTGVPKITLKLFSTAPIGTMVDIQMGIKSIDNYPAGIHSEFRTFTSKRNEWEQLTFDFLQLTPGSMVSSDTIDKVVLLFHPNSSDRDTIYIDELSGPPISSPQSAEELENGQNVILFQNFPNPSSSQTSVSFFLYRAGDAKLSLYSSYGQLIKAYLNSNLKSGLNTVSIYTDGLKPGFYYYVLDALDEKKFKTMVVIDQ